MSVRLSLAVAGALVALSAPQAFAHSPVVVSDGSVFHVRVATADLDLNTDAGAKVLFNRIHTAAKQGCGAEPGFTELERLRVYHACVFAAVDSTVTELGNPRLTALNSHPRNSASNLASADR